MSEDDKLQHDRLHQSRAPSLGKMSTEFFALPNLPNLNDFSSRDSRQMCADDPWCEEDFGFPAVNNNTLENGNGDQYSIMQLHRENWVVPMLALAAINVLVLVTFEVYVVCKVRKYFTWLIKQEEKPSEAETSVKIFGKAIKSVTIYKKYETLSFKLSFYKY